MSQLLAKKPRRVLSLFGLVMINIIAVDNLRGLAIGAEYGMGLIVIYGLVVLFFLIPSALVSSELATGWPNTGGIYVWVREAFGNTVSFVVIWLQWIYNVVWYPTLAIFMAGVLAHLIDPQLVNNKTYMVVTTLTIFWFATLVNCYGMRLSSRISTIGALVGTLFPMACIIFLGIAWLSKGHPSQIPLTAQALVPKITHWGEIAFLSAIVFALIGIEMSATHAAEVKNPEKNFPRAILISTIIIVTSLILSSLAITIVVPQHKLNIITGLMQGFDLFFERFQMPWANPLLDILVVIGSLGSMAAWIIGPTKGLMAAGQDGALPKFMVKQTQKGVPITILMLQGIIVTALCAVFLVLPTVSSSYWYLTDLTAQLALLSYIFFFAAVIRLRYVQPWVKRHFYIPGGKIGVWIVASLGIISCLFSMVVGFIPPHQINVGSVWRFELLLIVGMLIFILSPVLIVLMRNNKKREKINEKK